MRISEVANLTGLNISNIRFYERKGLLKPVREEDSKYRNYTNEDVTRLKQILLYRKMGISIETIYLLFYEQAEFGVVLERQKMELKSQMENLQGALDLCDLMLKEEKIHPEKLDAYLEYVHQEEERGKQFAQMEEFLDDLAEYTKISVFRYEPFITWLFQKPWIARILSAVLGALRVLLDNDTIDLEYDYKEYDFKIRESGRNPFGLEELSDGYSSVIQIVSDLILRMDKNWILGDEISRYDVEGIVLIDEIETHLHIALQKKIMPFLTEFFPRIQFIVTTHSPYILSSLSNAKIYDLENCMELEDLSVYSAEDLAEGYFGVDEYSDKLKNKIERYTKLKEKSGLTDEERAERAKLRSELQTISKGMSLEMADIFHDIEGKQL